MRSYYFSTLDPDQARELGRKGGQKSAAGDRPGHRFTSDEAKAARALNRSRPSKPKRWPVPVDWPAPVDPFA